MGDDEWAAHVRQGRRRLRDLLPAARASAAAKGADFSIDKQSAILKAMAPHVTEDRMVALVVYPAPLGGWHADLCFRDMPPGVSNALGTPAAWPCPDRKEAERQGRAFLEACLALAQRNRERPAPPPPAFSLCGWTVDLMPAFIAKAQAGNPEGYGSREQAVARIGQVMAEMCPHGFDGPAFDGWPMESRAKLLTVLHIAALNGVFRWPPPADAPPGTHAGASKARH